MNAIHRPWIFVRSLLEKLHRARVLEMVAAATAGELEGHVALPALDIIESDQLTHRWDAIYRRMGGRLQLELPRIAKLETAEKAGLLGPAYLYWLMQCPPEVEKIVVTLSDGDQPTMAQFGPSTNQLHVTPIPDPFFFRYEGHSQQRRFAEANDVAWASRTNDITWRGTSSGQGTFDPVLAAACPSRATQRILLCMAARNMPGVDIALTAYLRDEFKEDVLRRHGLLRAALPEDSWIGRKFAIDIDGQTNTWTNLIRRLHLGCCVIKVASREGYRQWYYDRLRPWGHFVPVKADLSDLQEQIEWVRSHDRDAQEIAGNGRALARSLTFEAGRREAVELILAHWREATYA